jgi:sec-independent protein translocase protein TatC
MSALQEIREIKNIILSTLVFLLACTVFFFVFGLHSVSVFGYSLRLPVPDTSTPIALQVFMQMKQDLVPDSVQLIVTSPTTGFVSQVTIAFLLAFFLSFPYFLYRVLLYMSPALQAVERRLLFLITLPALVLFATGAWFAYVFLIPSVFKVLYSYVLPGTAISFLAVDEFIGTVCSLLFTSGLMFLLPIAMIFLNFLGILPRDFWFKNWRGAVLTLLTISAIITPDGSGTSMIILSVPLVGLYTLGAGIRPKR